jgi:hypothetical protein
MLKRLIALPLACMAFVANAQTGPLADTITQPAVDYALDVYKSFRGDESNLYTGIAVEQSSVSARNTPYFGTGDWFTGSVVFDGVTYNGVTLKYDLVRDEVVVLNPKTRNAFYLFKPRVASFTLGAKSFINLGNDGRKSAPDEGYYEQLVNGPITLLKKWTKAYKENFALSNVDQRYDEKTRLYVLKDSVYRSVSGAATLYSLTGSHKNSIREQVKKAGVSSKSDSEETLVAIARTFNQTIN